MGDHVPPLPHHTPAASGDAAYNVPLTLATYLP
jgi:hypothetical protein